MSNTIPLSISELSLDLVAEQSQNLEKAGIKTLDDILDKKGLSARYDLGLDEATRKKLDSLANLSLLTDESTTIKALYDKGYHGIVDIAKKPEAEFITATKDKFGGEAAAKSLHGKASAQQKLIDDYLAYGKALRGNPGAINPDDDVDTALGAQAYLHALLEFVNANLKVDKDNNSCSRDWLQTNFYQDFSALENPKNKASEP